MRKDLFVREDSVWVSEGYGNRETNLENKSMVRTETLCMAKTKIASVTPSY